MAYNNHITKISLKQNCKYFSFFDYIKLSVPR